MHAQFPRSLNEKLVDKVQSYRNLETLREKQKVQLWQIRIRQSAQTTFKRKILKEEIESREYKETIDHLTSGCHQNFSGEFYIQKQ
jgi:hypothetical protein